MTNFARTEDGLSIAYDVVGEGTPIVLVHGFASSRAQNWKAPGWYDTLTGAGYRVVALDVRGHGESDKPHDPKLYGHEVQNRDVLAVMDAVGLSRAHVMGYSMGGFMSIHLLMKHETRIDKLVIGGVGGSYLEPVGVSRDRMTDPAMRERVAAALLVDDKTTIADPTARGFRDFAEQDGKDRLALAACMRGERYQYTREQLSRATRPVLVVCGENDLLTGPPDPLAAAFAHGRAVTVPRRDHMTAVGDKVYKEAALQFLASA